MKSFGVRSYLVQHNINVLCIASKTTKGTGAPSIAIWLSITDNKGDYPQAGPQILATAKQGLCRAHRLSLGTQGWMNLINSLQNRITKAETKK